MFLFNTSSNNKDKFLELYEKYKNYIFAIALSILKDTPSAEDVVQETAIRLYQNIDKVDISNHNRTKAYIAIITQNLSFKVYNKRKNIVSYDDNIFENSKSSENMSVENTIENLEAYNDLMALIHSLKPTYKEILLLGYVHELNNKEIAETLDISEVNVRKRKERARKELREKLEKVEVEQNE